MGVYVGGVVGVQVRCMCVDVGGVVGANLVLGVGAWVYVGAGMQVKGKTGVFVQTIVNGELNLV
jgi:hypothetical protein